MQVGTIPDGIVMRSVWTKYLCLFALWSGLLAADPDTLLAATNAATGGIGGINNGTLSGGDGTGTAQITINPIDLALVKQARDLSGTVLANGASVAAGQDIYFVVYVDNTTAFASTDFRITDLLDESAFTYIANSLETTVVPTGSNAAAIWAGGWTALTDTVGGSDDIASITNSGGPAGKDKLTIGATPGQVNQVMAIPASALRAIRFKVKVN